ncbi:MAG: flagellar hook-associated protein FlgL [Candidatus Zixiibacteriota bacterium]|nr:MAG: flagellar hook-associated protein FlgL [candidate division Zixibacteria bacterium]
MRITTSMMTGRVIFNMQRSIRRFTEMQTQMSSGRRINRPSDDPLGTLRDLSYRTELAKIEQFRENLSQGRNWINTYDSVLSDLTDFVNTATDLAQSMANDDKDASIRANAAVEVQSVLDQMIYLANKEIGGSQIFGGFKTKIDSFNQVGNGVVYNGDLGEIQFEIDAGQLMTINLDGSSVFLTQLTTLGEDADLNIGVTDATLLADLHLAGGVDLTTFTIQDRNNDALPISTIDLTGLTTVNDAITAINTQLAADGIINLTARLGDEGNNIVLESTEDGIICGSSLLAYLNSGNGVDLTPGEIIVTDGAGINVKIDLNGSLTIDDVITKFNTQLNAELALGGYAPVTMAINATNTGLTITDTNVPPLGLTIEDIDGSSTTAANLGILGTVYPVLDGTDLNPATHFEVAEAGGTAAADLGILGEFSGTRVGDDLDPLLTAIGLLASLDNRLGLPSGEITLHQGAASRTIDVDDPAFTTVQDLLDAFNNCGLDITASINTAGTGIQVVNNDTSKSFVIGEASLDHVAKAMGLFGSTDVMGSAVALRNALQKNDRKGSEMLVRELENSLQHLLNYRAEVGGRAIRLDSTDRRLVDANVNFTRLLSEVEDADLSELVTDLATFENNYNAALLSAAKIIQPTLLDFMKL